MSLPSSSTSCHAPLLASARRLAVRPNAFESRDAIEAYLSRLNHGSPTAERNITQWGAATAASLRLAAVPLPGSDRPGEAFMGEAEISFGLDVRARGAAAADTPYSVGLVLRGSMVVTLAGGEFVAGPGDGVIVDPADVERTQFSAGSHFVEFSVPKRQLLRLGAELAPGDLTGVPHFAPLLGTSLAQRLLLMGTQAADVLQTAQSPNASRAMFQRWSELIMLTLLHEQPIANSAALLAPVSAPPPACVRRALDFIDAYAASNIQLADIAAAACVSASSLLRHFRQHLGQSPGAFLRQVQLDRARAELKRGDAGSIREVAERWGFQNASKFSQAYLRRFGERPRDARSRG